jgi:hypothetical protein
MAVLGEKSLPASLLVNLAFISGTFIFAVLLGTYTQSLANQDCVTSKLLEAANKTSERSECAANNRD